jgi:dihydroorotase
MELLSSNPASILGLENKGKIAVGMDADMVLFDSNAKWKMEEKGSIYEGEMFFGSVDATYVNGVCVYSG